LINVATGMPHCNAKYLIKKKKFSLLTGINANRRARQSNAR
jgi:hypothetical protein